MARNTLSNHRSGRLRWLGCLPIFALLLALTGCNAWQNRAEFAAPQSRWPANLPSPVAADAPPPPVPAQYCYRTLASVDCYTEARPDRITGYTGVYPDPSSVATAAPYSVPPRQPLAIKIPSLLP
jgi:hypothetical protein